MSRHGKKTLYSEREHHSSFDMHAAARRVLLAAGFEPDLDAAAQSAARPASRHRRRCRLASKDLRELPWSSIDNNESRDLDQVEVAERLPERQHPAHRRHRRRRRARAARHAARRACVRELHVGVHRHRRLSDAAGKAVDGPHVAQRGRGSSRDRHRNGRRPERRRRVVRRLPRDGAQQGEARLRRRSAHFSTAERRRRRSPTTPVIDRAAHDCSDEASQRLKAERIRNGALEFDTIEATPVAKDGTHRRPQGHAQEPGARSDRGFHDREQRRDREIPRVEGPLGDSTRGARARALGHASWSSRGATARTCPPSPIRSHWRKFLIDRRTARSRRFPRSLIRDRQADGTRASTRSICRARIRAATSGSRRTTTRTPPRPTAATPIS